MRKIQIFIFLCLLTSWYSLADSSKKEIIIHTDRAKTPSIDFYDIDQTENIEAAIWQSTKNNWQKENKNYLPIVRVPLKNRSNAYGWAIFTFTVNEKGSTTDITLIDEEPKGAFSVEGARAISRFKYKPYSPNGTAKKVRNVWHTFEFKNFSAVADRDCSEGSEEIYKGTKIHLNQEKYLVMSKDERKNICLKMKNIYKEIISSECLTTFDINTGIRSCLSGKRLEVEIERSKNECKFACQP